METADSEIFGLYRLTETLILEKDVSFQVISYYLCCIQLEEESEKYWMKLDCFFSQDTDGALNRNCVFVWLLTTSLQSVVLYLISTAEFKKSLEKNLSML